MVDLDCHNSKKKRWTISTTQIVKKKDAKIRNGNNF